MDTKELKGLMEAYVDVYSEERLDEGIRSAIKRLLGGGKKEVEGPKPESRGAELRRRYNVGPERSDTSAKRQILNRSRARAERDQKEYGDSKYSKSVAQKSKDQHDRYLKAGYSKYGADDARGRGNKARKRAEALNREEFDCIVDTLLDEGYDLSNYTVDEFYNICLDEAVVGMTHEEVDQLDEISVGLANRVKDSREDEYYVDSDIFGGRSSEARRSRKKFKNAERIVAKKVAAAKKEKEQKNNFSNRLTRSDRKGIQDSYDLYDLVLSHLLGEGYAETPEQAEVIMVNMSEDWREDIVEASAAAQRGLPEPHRSKDINKRSADYMRTTPSGRRQLAAQSAGHRQRQTPAAQEKAKTTASNLERMNRINARPRTTKEKNLAGHITRAGRLGS